MERGQLAIEPIFGSILRMALISFYPPNYVMTGGGWWPYTVENSLITLQLSDVIAACTSRIEGLEEGPLRRSVEKLSRELEAFENSQFAEVERDETRRELWDAIRPIMFSRQFVSVTCPRCKRTLTPSSDHTLIGEWRDGNTGGHRLVCVRRHVLYVNWEWIT
jgi:hypothetical protein